MDETLSLIPAIESAVVLSFPLGGTWVAQNTPAQAVPSHGTDAYGQRHAYDFCRLDAQWDLPYTPRAFWPHVFGSIGANEFYCWDAPVVSSFDGTVVTVKDGWPDRQDVNLSRELIRGSLLPPQPKDDDFRPLAGNYVLVEGEDGIAFYAHLRRGSLCVEEGQRVRCGDEIGRVGNSGNSTMPHLHFHLMDSTDFRTAAGVPCAFRNYERQVDGSWEQVARGIPERLERIRHLPARSAQLTA